MRHCILAAVRLRRCCQLASVLIRAGSLPRPGPIAAACERVVLRMWKMTSAPATCPRLTAILFHQVIKRGAGAGVAQGELPAQQRQDPRQLGVAEFPGSSVLQGLQRGAADAGGTGEGRLGEFALLAARGDLLTKFGELEHTPNILGISVEFQRFAQYTGRWAETRSSTCCRLRSPGVRSRLRYAARNAASCRSHPAPAKCAAEPADL